MVDVSEVLTWVLLVGFSFLPPIIYTVWLRNTERCNRQNWYSIFICFLWGASIAIIAALIFEVLLEIPLDISIENTSTVSLITAVLLAPIVEEFTKPLALQLRSVKKQIGELEDGLIYGAVAGLGFSATENLLYGYSFLTEGLLVFIVLIIIRSFGGCLLHASATALTGYGYGKTLLKHSTFLRVIPYFLLAIGVHATYNFLISFDTIGMISGFIAAMVFVGITITLVRKKIKTLDEQTCPPKPPVTSQIF